MGIRTNTVLGCLYLISMYVPPNSKVNIDLLIELTDKIPSDGKIVLMGDFNAHLSTFLPFRMNKMGGTIIQLQEILNLNILNDGSPTFVSNTDYMGSVLDLHLVSAELSTLCSTTTLPDCFGSDHNPVSLNIAIRVAPIAKALQGSI